MMRQVVEEQLGGECIFLQGAAGNIHTRRGHTGDLKVYRRWGKILGLEASKIATSIETLPRREKLEGVIQSGAAIALFRDEPEEPATPVLRVDSRYMKLPLKDFRQPEVLEAEVEGLRKELNRLRREGNEEEIRAATARATQAGMQAEYARWYYGKTHVDWQLQGIRIGSVALLSIPGEPFVEINNQIVAGSPFAHTLFSGYSNGGFGYLATRAAFEEGGYELDVCPFSADAADVVVNESLLMLREMINNDG